MAKEKTYRIGDACSQVDIQPYVLRYWETEFPPLSPDKSRSGQRLYTESDLQVIRRIKELLYDEGYTIAGAKKKLEAELDSGGPQLSKASASEEETEKASASAPTSAAKPAKKSTAKRKTAAKKKSSKVAKKAATRTTSKTKAKGDGVAPRQLSSLRSGVEKVLTEARSLLRDLES